VSCLADGNSKVNMPQRPVRPITEAPMNTYESLLCYIACSLKRPVALLKETNSATVR